VKYLNVISDAQARTIAADWHGGQASALYSLASSGAITDPAGTKFEISRDVRSLDTGRARRPLLALYKYVEHHGERGPVEGWAQLWDATEPTLEEC